MALKKCKECGEKVSTKAKTCPSCGAKAPKKTSALVWLLLASFAFMFYMSSQGNLSTKPAVASPSLSPEQKAEIEREAKLREQASFEKDTVYHAKKTVANLLKDPDSAKFKNVFFNETEKGGAVACGQVNSKNSFGAYSGFQRFISNSKTTFLEEKAANFTDIWKQACLPEK